MSVLVEPEQLASQLDDTIVVDCRFDLARPSWGEAEWRRASVPGAAYAHLDRDLSGPVTPGQTGRHPLPDPHRFAETLAAWGVEPTRAVVVFDQLGGGIAARLWWMLRWLGHDAVSLLNGGWAAWLGAGLPTAPGVAVQRSGGFVPRPRGDKLVDAVAVQAAIADPSVALLDARSAERHRGDHEPIDPVAGRIPGALSAPSADNLDASGRLLPKEQLARRYRSLLGDAQRTISYCGSGVTACHDILALVHAGLPEPELYAGSWSDWITDPSRPIERG